MAWHLGHLGGGCVLAHPEMVGGIRAQLIPNLRITHMQVASASSQNKLKSGKWESRMHIMFF